MGESSAQLKWLLRARMQSISRELDQLDQRLLEKSRTARGGAGRPAEQDFAPQRRLELLHEWARLRRLIDQTWPQPPGA